MGKKALYISGSLGLGHVARDLAIANELRKLKPDCEISWIAEQPAAGVLKDAGEKVVDENWSHLNQTVNIHADEKNQFDLLTTNSYLLKHKEDFANYLAIVEREKPDIVVGDEAYQLLMGFTENPALIVKLPFIHIWDFIKFYTMSPNPYQRLSVWMVNRLWQNNSRIWNQKPLSPLIFLFPEDDVPDEKLGLFLMNTREAIKKYKSYFFVGYPLQFDPADYQDKTSIRKRLGYGKEPLIICAVGGTAFGKGLLDLCGKAYPLIKAQIPDVKMVMVAGPVIDAKSLKVPDGVEIRGYVSKLFEHYAACDLAIVLGGGSSTLELAALKRPFLYFPLEKHFEQSISVANRNERYHAGIKMRFPKTTPEMLTQTVISNLGKKVEYLDMPIDGCKKAAEVIAKFM